jgi:hypothetical protein
MGAANQIILFGVYEQTSGLPLLLNLAISAYCRQFAPLATLVGIRSLSPSISYCRRFHLLSFIYSGELNPGVSVGGRNKPKSILSI